jgi:hypothetical protein
MASPAKTRSHDLYTRLLLLYPAHYRRQYGEPMVQTFDDMLADEPTRLGRASLWLRALWDIPQSAVNIYITDGKEIHMSRNTKIILTVVAAFLLLANGASFWFGTLHARQTSGVQQVTPTQLADAMQNDHFYSSYGGAALLFSGTVANVQQQNGDSLVRFSAGHTFAVTCQFAGAPKIHAGQKLAVAAPGGSAERLAKGVLLHGCVQD